MNQPRHRAQPLIEPFKAPAAVDLIGDALLCAIRRPALFAPLLLLDGLLVLTVLMTGAPVGAQLTIRSIELPVSAGVLAGLLVPALLPFGGLDLDWQLGVSELALSNELNAVWVAVVILSAALLGVYYLVRLAAEMTPPTEPKRDRINGASAFRRCVELAALLLVIPLFVGGPVLVAGLVMNRVESSRLPLLMAITILLALAFFVLRFSFDAIVIDNVAALEAIARSWSVVTQQPLAAFRLVALSLCIAAGTQVLWVSMIESPLGFLIATVGNAFIATTLALARMNFYRNVRDVIPRRASVPVSAAT